MTEQTRSQLGSRFYLTRAHAVAKPFPNKEWSDYERATLDYVLALEREVKALQDYQDYVEGCLV